MRSTSLFLAQTLVYGCVFETVAFVGSQRSRSVSMERLGQTPRKEQKSIFDFVVPSCALCLVAHKKTASLMWEGLPGVVPETRRSAGSAKADTVAVPTLKKLCFCGPPATAHRPPRRTRLNRGPGRSTKSFKNYLISHAICEGGSGVN